MGYSIKHGKLQSNKLARSLKQADRLLSSLPDETRKNIEKDAAELGPREFAKKVARQYLAHQVGEHAKKNLQPVLLRDVFSAADIPADMPKDATIQDMWANVPEDMIVEVIEQMVEGDFVLDDAETHQWFRKKLDDYRDFCIKIDEDPTTDILQAGFFLRALDYYDCLIQRDHGVSPTHGALVANAKTRAALSGNGFADIEWNADGLPIPDDLRKDFQVGGIVITVPSQPSWDPILKFAQLLVQVGNLRVAFIDKWGGVSEADLSELEPLAGSAPAEYEGAEAIHRAQTPPLEPRQH